MRPSKRALLLQAAANVVRRDGSDALTLERVAAEAGVSKGGLLYHFDSKAALVRGLVDALVAGFETKLGTIEDGEPGSFTRAYLRATAQPSGHDEAVTAALLAAVAVAPELLEPLRARYRVWAKRFDADGIDATDALIVRLASDGLWLAELLGFEPPSRKRRQQVLARLSALTKHSATPPQAAQKPRRRSRGPR
jgi:AcrR family transcriptional regulator